MLIGSATRYLGGRGTVQTVYWRASRKNEKLVKIGKNFNLKKPITADSDGIKSRYAGKMTDNKGVVMKIRQLDKK